MRTYLARLGAFTFGINTAAFQDLQRVSTYRWEGKNRIGRKPAQQNLGDGADTIRLTGVIYPHYRGGLGQMAALRAQASTGEPLPLVYAFESVGQYCGKWCITSIEETRTVFFDNGTPRKIEFSLSLVEYGEDAGLATPLAQIAAIASAGGVSGVDASGAVSSAGRLASEAASVSTQAGALSMVGSVVATAQGVASTISTAVADVLNSDAVRLAKSSVTEIAKLKDAAKAVQGAVKSVEGIAQNPSTALGAFGNLAASAGTMSDVLGTAGTKLAAVSGKFSGASTGSLFDKQVGSASSLMDSLSTASSSLQATAVKLKGFF